MTGCAENQLRQLAPTTNIIYKIELFANVATVRTLRLQLISRRLVPFTDNETARAPLTRGIARNGLALILIHSQWVTAGEDTSTLRVKRVQSAPNPADDPLRVKAPQLVCQVEIPFPPLRKILGNWSSVRSLPCAHAAGKQPSNEVP